MTGQTGTAEPSCFRDFFEAVAERAAQLVLERLELPTPRESSEFLTIVEAAELIRSKRQRVDDLLSAGKLRRFKDGSRTLLSRAEVLAYLDDGVAPMLPRGAATRIGTGVSA